MLTESLKMGYEINVGWRFYTPDCWYGQEQPGTRRSA
jgi:hypothetical protein